MLCIASCAKTTAPAREEVYGGAGRAADETKPLNGEPRPLDGEPRSLNGEHFFMESADDNFDATV